MLNHFLSSLEYDCMLIRSVLARCGILDTSRHVMLCMCCESCRRCKRPLPEQAAEALSSRSTRPASTRSIYITPYERVRVSPIAPAQPSQLAALLLWPRCAAADQQPQLLLGMPARPPNLFPYTLRSLCSPPIHALRLYILWRCSMRVRGSAAHRTVAASI